jgi:hypothetical protein
LAAFTKTGTIGKKKVFDNAFGILLLLTCAIGIFRSKKEQAPRFEPRYYGKNAVRQNEILILGRGTFDHFWPLRPVELPEEEI